MTTTSRRAAHVAPHQFNRIKPAMSLPIVAPQDPSTEPIKEMPELDLKPGAHFVGLLAPVNRSEMAQVAEEAAAADDDDEGAKGGRIGDRGLLGLVVAKRLVAARLLNGYSQIEAATVVGYGTPAQLSQWEAGKRRPPLAALVQYADVMAVSVDYLLGRSEDAERDVRLVRQNACMRAVRSTLAAAVERIVDAFDSDESITGLNVGTVLELVAAAQAVTAVYGDFIQPYRAGRGNLGEHLASAVNRLEGAALKVGVVLRRHDDEDARMRQRLADIAANDPH